MTFPNFIKDNIILIIGIFLPALLVAFFILASAIPRMMSTAPLHDFFFTMKHYKSIPDNKLSINISVNSDGYIKATAKETEHNARYYPELYRYRAKDGFAIQVKSEYFIDQIFDNKEEILKTKTLKIPKSIANIKVSDSMISSDGYTLDTTYRYRNRGLIGEVFSISNKRCMYRLVKNNASFPFEIYQLNNNSYNCYYSANGIKFLGWILPNNVAKE